MSIKKFRIITAQDFQTGVAMGIEGVKQVGEVAKGAINMDPGAIEQKKKEGEDYLANLQNNITQIAGIIANGDEATATALVGSFQSRFGLTKEAAAKMLADGLSKGTSIPGVEGSSPMKLITALISKYSGAEETIRQFNNLNEKIKSIITTSKTDTPGHFYDMCIDAAISGNFETVYASLAFMSMPKFVHYEKGEVGKQENLVTNSMSAIRDLYSVSTGLTYEGKILKTVQESANKLALAWEPIQRELVRNLKANEVTMNLMMSDFVKNNKNAIITIFDTINSYQNMFSYVKNIINANRPTLQAPNPSTAGGAKKAFKVNKRTITSSQKSKKYKIVLSSNKSRQVFSAGTPQPSAMGSEMVTKIVNEQNEMLKQYKLDLDASIKGLKDFLTQSFQNVGGEGGMSINIPQTLMSDVGPLITQAATDKKKIMELVQSDSFRRAQQAADPKIDPSLLPQIKASKDQLQLTLTQTRVSLNAATVFIKVVTEIAPDVVPFTQLQALFQTEKSKVDSGENRMQFNTSVIDPSTNLVTDETVNAGPVVMRGDMIERVMQLSYQVSGYSYLFARKFETSGIEDLKKSGNLLKLQAAKFNNEMQKWLKDKLKPTTGNVGPGEGSFG
jgi:Holliday junction resolvase RusA-like endonuclease